MAKRAGTILAGVFTIMCCASLWAQQKSSVKQNSKSVKDTAATTGIAAKGKKIAAKPLVYLGHSNYAGGDITVGDFTTLLKQGISSKDETGRSMKIIGFNFNYAERRLFENEAGEMSMMIDFSTEYCPGDTITENISKTIYERIKGGDTIFISQVLLEKKIGNDIDTIYGKEMKCVFNKNAPKL